MNIDLNIYVLQFVQLQSQLWCYVHLSIHSDWQAHLRHSLPADNQGQVSYSQFVQVAKRLFSEDLKHWDVPASTPSIPQQSQATAVTQRQTHSIAPRVRVNQLSDCSEPVITCQILRYIFAETFTWEVLFTEENSRILGKFKLPL